ncbi:porin [Halomonas sp. 7T]|uniref:porin n=1 Tax=Halomonas sp. 7T TaxID=2893469 RepID=UPI0021D9C250|nr:porin [Halomonas sp. 7T]UXZ53001.1 porin [Halomonas sp. 7T]
MKKTLLATAIIGALGASAAAQAATVYDQDGTKLDVYGRIAVGIAGGGPDYRSATGAEQAAGAGENVSVNNGAEFVDVYSRLGLRMSHEVTRDLTAFGRLEWRFRADESGNRNGNSFSAFSETRQAYLGLQSDQFGTFQAGNFDSMYNQFVSLPFDVYIDRGLEFAGHPTQSRGDSIGYYTPDLSGFTAFLQLKHFSERGLRNDGSLSGGAARQTTDDGSEVASQGGVRYAQGPVTIGLGFVDDVARGDGGNDEMRYGLIGSYAITDQFSARLGYETRSDNDTFGGGFDTVGLGGTFATGPWAFNADIYNVDRDNDDSRTAWALGAYYKVSSNFDVFTELHQADQQSVDITVGGSDAISVDRADGDDVYWLTGARYHF